MGSKSGFKKLVFRIALEDNIAVTDSRVGSKSGFNKLVFSITLEDNIAITDSRMRVQ